MDAFKITEHYVPSTSEDYWQTHLSQTIADIKPALPQPSIPKLYPLYPTIGPTPVTPASEEGEDITNYNSASGLVDVAEDSGVDKAIDLVSKQIPVIGTEMKVANIAKSATEDPTQTLLDFIAGLFLTGVSEVIGKEGLGPYGTFFKAQSTGPSSFDDNPDYHAAFYVEHSVPNPSPLPITDLDDIEPIR